MSEQEDITINRSNDVLYNFPTKDYKLSQNLYPTKGKISKSLVGFLTIIKYVLEEEKTDICKRYSKTVKELVDNKQYSEISPDLLKFGILKATLDNLEKDFVKSLNEQDEFTLDQIDDGMIQHFNSIGASNTAELTDSYMKMTGETVEDHSCLIM